MNQKGFTNIIIPVVIVVLLGVVGYFVFVQKSEVPSTTLSPQPESINETSVSPSLVSVSSDWKFIDKEFFTVNIPPGWQFNESQGIDSYTGELVGDGMKLILDYGVYSDPLLVDENTHIVTYEYPSGRRAKIVVPNREVVESGTTGVHFEELVAHGNNIFSLVGNGLNMEQEAIAIKIIWTLRFNWYGTSPPPQPDDLSDKKKEE